MSARPSYAQPQPAPRWTGPHFKANTMSLTVDYPKNAPGVLAYNTITETDGITGEIRRITCQPSKSIPGGVSLTYPSHDTLMAHVAVMQIEAMKAEMRS